MGKVFGGDGGGLRGVWPGVAALAVPVRLPGRIWALALDFPVWRQGSDSGGGRRHSGGAGHLAQRVAQPDSGEVAHGPIERVRVDAGQDAVHAGGWR